MKINCYWSDNTEIRTSPETGFILCTTRSDFIKSVAAAATLLERSNPLVLEYTIRNLCPTQGRNIFEALHSSSLTATKGTGVQMDPSSPG